MRARLRICVSRMGGPIRHVRIPSGSRVRRYAAAWGFFSRYTSRAEIVRGRRLERMYFPKPPVTVHMTLQVGPFSFFIFSIFCCCWGRSGVVLLGEVCDMWRYLLCRCYIRRVW